MITVYPSDFEKNITVLIITTASIALMAMIIYPNSLLIWIASFILYPILVILYHAPGSYGIGYGMFAFVGFSVVFISMIVLVTEIITWSIIYILFFRLIKNSVIKRR